MLMLTPMTPMTLCLYCKLLTTCLDPGLIDELLFYSMSEEIYWLRILNRRHSGSIGENNLDS